MDSVLEVLGIFLRLFIALGVSAAAGIAVYVAAEVTAFPGSVFWGGLTVGFVSSCHQRWVMGG